MADLYDEPMSLPCRSRVVGSCTEKKNPQQVGVPELRRIETYLYDFGMACLFRTDLLICRIFFVSAGISGYNVLDTLKIVKNCFNTPKTTRSQSGRFKNFFHI